MLRRRTALVALTLAALALASACGGDDDRPASSPTTAPVANTATASSPAPSTPGASSTQPSVSNGPIVYEASVDNVTNIYTIDPVTREMAQLTNGTQYDGAPSWAPDRSHLLFSSDRGQARRKDDVYAMAPDGSGVRRITNTPVIAEQHAKYSPDGTQIAYVSKLEAEYRLGIMNADGTNAREVTEQYQFIEFPAWKRDGTEIWFAGIPIEATRAADIFSIDLATGQVRTRISTPQSDVCPHFTRDGLAMSYASAPHGDPEGMQDIHEHSLSSDDTSGADDAPLTDNAARDDYANPSPDGTQWVFLSQRDNNFELYLMDRDGSNERRLTNTPLVRENVPDW